MNGDNGNEWDRFNFDAWGNDAPEPGMDRNGSSPDEPATGDEAEEAGHWESVGGVLRWEGPEEGAQPPTLLDEARSQWAAEQVDLPPGAPDPARVRATRAWLARQRVLEGEALGQVLYERRLLLHSGSLDEAPEHDEDDASPLGLALAEHTAAMQEYERLLEVLGELEAHSGPARVLVEYHLALTERLAELASAPEAPADFAAGVLLAEVEDEEAAGAQGTLPTPRSVAEWQGRARAAVLARRRVERVTLPDPDE
jgi:hypothetical protein